MLKTTKLESESWGAFRQRLKLTIPKGKEPEYVERALGVREDPVSKKDAKEIKEAKEDRKRFLFSPKRLPTKGRDKD